MNQKEFELIAQRLKYQKTMFLNDNHEQYAAICKDWATMLTINYSKTFDRSKFMRACGL